MSTSAPFSSEKAQICILAAVRIVLGRMHPEVAARWLGCSTTTIDRVIRGGCEESAGRWTTERTCQLVSAERSVLGTRYLADVLIETFGSVAPDVGGSVTNEIGTGLASLMNLARDEAVSVADGQVTDAEVKHIAAEIPKALEHLQRLRVVCSARLDRRTP